MSNVVTPPTQTIAEFEAEGSKKATQTKEKRKEKENAEEDQQFVIDGAVIQCTSCMIPIGTLKVNFNTPTIQEKKTATVKEKNAMSLKFSGNCLKSPKAELPCKAVMKLGEWQDVGTTLVQDQKPLIKKSTIMCNYGGSKIKFLKSGQINVPSVIEPKNPLSLKIDSKCIVHFRPHTKWNGTDYGFDWMRLGDTDLIKQMINIGGLFPGDVNYENIIGDNYKDAAFTKLEENNNEIQGYFKKNPDKYKLLKKEYLVHNITWKNKKDATGNTVPEEYFCSWLSILPKKKITLSLVLDVEEIPDLLKFEDNENFTISPKEFVPNKKGKYGLPNYITIECLKDFSEDQTIEIKSIKNGIPHNAGKLIAWRNASTKIKKIKVILIKVILPIYKDTSKSIFTDLSGKKQEFDKFLNQAFIQTDIEIIDLDLSKDPNFMPGGLYANEQGIICWYADANKTPKGFMPAEFYLHSKLYALITKVRPDLKNDYPDLFKCFYLESDGFGVKQDGSTQSLGGYVGMSNLMVVLKGKHDVVSAHELLHSFDVQHPFCNESVSKYARFSFKARTTDNIMDYSFHLGIKTFSLWKWQWEIAYNGIERREKEKKIKGERIKKLVT